MSVRVRHVGGAGELSTGTGALLFLGVLWILTEMGRKKLS